jgi:hypothetical protein
MGLPRALEEENLRAVLDMFDFGVDLMRERLRREHPDAEEGAIEQLLTTWLHTRPRAEHGDYDDGA